MADNPVRWFEIYVRDMTRARAFYELLLDDALTQLQPPTGGIEMWGFPGGVASAGATGALVKMVGAEPGAGGTVVYFRCNDCTQATARAAMAGGRIERPRTSIGSYGFIALVRDTENNLIGLHSPA